MGSFRDGVFTCGFRRIKNLIRSKRSATGDDEDETKMIDLDKTWHLMIGSGPASTSMYILILLTLNLKFKIYLAE